MDPYTYRDPWDTFPRRSTRNTNQHNHRTNLTCRRPSASDMISMYRTRPEPMLGPLCGLFDDMDFLGPRRYHYSPQPTNLSDDFFEDSLLGPVIGHFFSANGRMPVAPQPRRRHQPPAAPRAAPPTAPPAVSPAAPRRFNPTNPKFDNRQTENGYILRADLPGFKKENIKIQLTSPHILQIHGHMEHPEEEKPAPEPKEKEQSGLTEAAAAEPTKKTNKYQATVEDDAEDSDSWSEVSTTGAWTPVSSESPKPEQAEPASTQEPKKSAEVQKAASDKTSRFVAEFTRSFEFPTDVDPDEVTATMKNGQLTVILFKKRSAVRNIPVL